MKICESECIPVPFKTVCPQVSSLWCPGQSWDNFLSCWGRDKFLRSLKWRWS